jgi:AsmA protein
MRWIVRSLLALGLLVALGIGALFLIPTERIAGLAVQEFNRLTGRELRIDGSVRPTIWPVLGVTTGPVTLSNADWSDAGPMLSADGLAISVDLSSLMSGAPRVTEIRADGMKVVLERAKDGRENWVFGGDNGGEVTTATPGVGASFSLDQARVTGGTLVYLDHQTGLRKEVTNLDATFELPSFTGPADIDLTGQMNGQDFSLTAGIAGFKDFLDGALVGIKADLGAGAAKIAFDGKASLTGPEAAGAITADLARLAEISALAGSSAPALPAGLGAKSVAVAGDMTLTAKGSVHLRRTTVTLDGNAMSVDADLEPGRDRPHLTAKVTAGALDLRALTGGGGSGGSDAAASGGWSQASMDLSGLGAIDAEVSIAADSLDLGLIKAAPLRAVVTIDRSRVVTDLRKVGAYGGAISGNFVINARKGLSMGGDLTFSGMDLQPLLTDFAGVTRLTGQGDLAVKFVGSGASMAAIMNSLSGDGRIALGAGEIQGLDIEGMITNLDPSYVGSGKKTVYDDLTASFTLADGDLLNQDLVLNSPYLKAEGNGRIGLGRRDIDYRIKATALRAADGTGGVGVPVIIKGPWSDPSYALDLESLAQERLDEELAKLEEEAKAKAAALEADAKAKLEAELERVTGGQVQEGESLEDAANRLGKDVIEDEAAKALERLLGQGN